MKLNLAKRVYLVVVFALAGTAMIAMVSWSSIARLSDTSRHLGDVSLSSVVAIYEASDLYQSQNEMVNRAPAQTDMKALEKMPEDFARASQKLDAKIAELKKLDVQGALSEKIKAFETDIDGLRKESDKVFALSAQFQQVEATTLLQTTVNGLQDRIGSRLDELMKTALNAAEVQPRLIVQQAGKSSDLIIGLCLAVLLASMTASVILVRRQVVRPVKLVADRLGQTFQLTEASVQEITKNSQSVAEGASEQAASLEETSASLEEMSSMTKNNADNARAAKDLANQTRVAAESGASDMQAMSEAMTAIKASSDNISKIIKTIDEIAFQTNILALNAAVEAARAGEAGLGFAVVAEEVRGLAQRCAQAAKETAVKIEDSVSKSERGVNINEKVANALTVIVAKARKMDELVGEIASASHEQSQGIGQVNAAMTQMDKVTQTNAASAEESASAANELNAQAGAMKAAVAELLNLVGGNTQAENVPSKAPERPAATRQVHVSTSPGTSNGNPRKAIMAKNPHQSSPIPMDDDFKNF